MTFASELEVPAQAYAKIRRFQPVISSRIAFALGKCVLSVLSAVAQQQRITLSERTKGGLQRAKRAGRKLGREG
jgi:hypothetical protein